MWASKAIPHPSFYLSFNMDKTHHEPVISLFSAKLKQHFWSYVGGALVTKLFSLYVIDKHILASHQIITQE